MKPEEFAKSLEFILDALLRWVACLRSPAALTRSILSLAADPGDAFKRAISIWITATLLSVIVRSWAFQLHGLGLGNMAFLLTSTLLLLCVLLGFALCLQLGFRLFRLPIPFDQTFVTYTVHISAWAPFIALMLSPFNAQSIGLIKSLKASGVGLDQLHARYFAAPIVQEDSALAVVLGLVLGVYLPLLVVQLALVLGFLAERNQLPKAAVFSAGSFGMVLGAIPVVLASLVHVLVFYAFL